MKQKTNTTFSGYSSNSRIFENRGDPWTTEREGIKDFHREADELPELDAYWRARRALQKQPDHVGTAKVVERELTPREKILHRHQNAMLDIANRARCGVKQKDRL